ncbi:MAG: rhodanese-like domain-containing protein [Thermoleophilia bacterium]
MSNTVLMILLGATGGIILQRLGIINRLKGIRTVSAHEANEMIGSQGAVVLDVREADEYAASRIPAARHIPLGQIKARISELESVKDQPIVVNCRSGSRSARACSVLHRHGFEQVYNLKGGLRAWVGANLSIER